VLSSVQSFWLRVGHSVSVALAVVATASCSAQQTEKPALTMPVGLLSAHDGGFVTGVYASTADADPDCCWIGGDAAFQVQAPADGRTLVVTVYVPDLDVFHRRAQSLRVETGSGVKKQFSGLTPGIHALSVPLPPRARPQTIDVVLKSGYTFNPKREGINSDTRSLALYLKAAVVR
jgi:hypothetical protein